MAERTLTVRVIGDDAALKRTFASSERSTKTFFGRMNALNQGARGGLSGFGGRSSLLFGSPTFISTAAITAALGKSVSAASDLNEQIAKSRQIFGDASRATEEWSQTTARSMGIAQAEALRATGTFGNLFATVELAPDVAAEMSRALVQLAADLASFNNASPEDVLQAIRSGLIGEAEPLRRYGVLLSEARVQQEAMAATGKNNVKALTDQEKALARYQIILQDTAPAQGDFARTSQGLANQSRILRANLNDLSADIGGLLVPGLTDAAVAANFLLEEFGKLGAALDDFQLLGDPFGGKSLLELLGLEGTVDKSLIDVIRDAFGDAGKALDEALRPDDRPGARGPGAIAAENTRQAIEERQRQLKEAQRALERSRRSFGAFIKGLGLKLDRAGLTQGLNDDIAVLREIERAIERQIDREGRTFKLVDQLTRVRQQITDTVAQRAAINAQRARDAAQAAREEAQAAKELAQAMRDARIGRQFEALGLTAEGEVRAPGVGALQRRLRSLRDQVKGTALDTDKTRSQLRRIAKVLAGEFGLVGRDVRNAILQMFKDITDALEDKTGAKTKFRKGNVEDLLRGLGLSPEELKALRARLSQVGAGGAIPGKGIGAFGFAVPRDGGGNFIVNINGNVVTEDADSFLRDMQKRGRRGSIGRRGVGAGVGLGLG